MDDPAWHLAFGIIGMCVSPRLSGEGRWTGRGGQCAMASLTGLAGRKGKGRGRHGIL
jgi:hypothetical protein